MLTNAHRPSGPTPASCAVANSGAPLAGETYTPPSHAAAAGSAPCVKDLSGRPIAAACSLPTRSYTASSANEPGLSAEIAALRMSSASCSGMEVAAAAAAAAVAAGASAAAAGPMAADTAVAAVEAAA